MTTEEIQTSAQDIKICVFLFVQSHKSSTSRSRIMTMFAVFCDSERLRNKNLSISAPHFRGE